MSVDRISEEDLTGLIQKLNSLEPHLSENERGALSAVFQAAGRYYAESSLSQSDSMGSRIKRTKGVSQTSGYDEIFKIYEPVRRRSTPEKTKDPEAGAAQEKNEEPPSG